MDEIKRKVLDLVERGRYFPDEGHFGARRKERRVAVEDIIRILKSGTRDSRRQERSTDGVTKHLFRGFDRKGRKLAVAVIVDEANDELILVTTFRP